MTKIYINENGIDIDFDFETDLSTATEITLTVTKPDTTEIIWLLSEVNTSIINNTIIRHNVINSELDLAGVYIINSTITIGAVTNPSASFTFTVSARTDIIIINDDDLNEIKSYLGYPLQDNIILSDDQIKDLCVKRALRDYFIKFPKELALTQTLGFETETKFDFPNDSVYGVKDVRVVNKGDIVERSDSFWTLATFNSIYGGRGSGLRKYGTKFSFDPYGLSNIFLQSDVTQSIINVSTIKFRVDLRNRQLIVYNEVEGIVNILWAEKSNYFDDVKFEQKNDVIELSAAYLKLHMANSSGISTDSTQDVVINVDELKTDAKELMDGVKEKWDTYPDIIIIRD